MAGLLDFLNTAEAQTGLGLLAAGGARSDGANFGQRLLEGLSQGDRWKAQQAATKRAEMQDQMAQMQMAQAQAQMAQQQKLQGLAQQFARPAVGMAADGYGPSAPASFDRQGYGAALEGIDPIAGMQYQASIQKDNTPIMVAPGASLVDKATLKPIFTAPKEQNLPSALQEYEYAKKQGYAGSYLDFQLAQKKAGANNTTVSIAGPENKFNQDIGAGLARDALSVVDVARTAPNAISTAQSIRNALDKGAITGTGADVRLGVQKALETAGLVGSGQAASTQELMGSLSKITLNGIKTSGLGGGNGFTDKDKVFLESAISGTIADTPDNLRRVADLTERIARANHQKGSQVLGRWQKNPALAGFAQDISIDPLPQEQPSSANRSNLVNDLPKIAPVGSRARDTATGQIMRFDGLKWKPE